MSIEERTPPCSLPANWDTKDNALVHRNGNIMLEIEETRKIEPAEVPLEN